MQAQPLDIGAVNRLAAAKGIDTRTELARLIGISQPHLSRILNGNRPCLPSHLLSIAKALDVDPDDILAKESA